VRRWFNSAGGVSIWVSRLLDKYLFHRPTYRLPADWAAHGLDLSPGTVTDGLKHPVPLATGRVVISGRIPANYLASDFVTEETQKSN
jgi:hypothetical protein